ncbi:MAG: hypothetical protein GY844_29640 [Bradyrhizobium sp.]|jgi:hypothetical protein|uniref:hypothetical protein n=1 Tax=Sphingomonas sp. VL_57B TaxID=3144220 RepID=UPI0031F508B8|nr:hypothetical protein [Bradyrhizobium sp.]
MRVAGLDLSKSSTGWAVWGHGDAVLASGTWQLGSEFTSRGRVFANLHARMMEIEALGHVDAWFYEEPIHPAQLQGGTNAETVKLAAGLASHVESAGEALGARIIRAVNMSTWRREFLGKMPRAMKTADLKDMAMQRCRQLGFKPLKHDQAEAIGILDYACASLNLVPYWRAQEVLRPPLGVRA